MVRNQKVLVFCGLLVAAAGAAVTANSLAPTLGTATPARTGLATGLSSSAVQMDGLPDDQMAGQPIASESDPYASRVSHDEAREGRHPRMPRGMH